MTDRELMQQEPVAWMHPDWQTYTRAPAVSITPKEGWHPLYTAPRQWQGLTEAEKVNVAISCGCADVAWIDFADAIEARLREKNS